MSMAEGEADIGKPGCQGAGSGVNWDNGTPDGIRSGTGMACDPDQGHGGADAIGTGALDLAFA